MSMLIQELVKYIEDKIRPVIRASGGGDARFEFLGAPVDILERLLDHFSRAGGISFELGGKISMVPVYLLDEVKVNPKGLDSGCCDDSHLTNVRNNCPYFLALIPPHKLENRSISTSATMIGVPRLVEGQKLNEQPLIDDLISKAIASKGHKRDIFEDCIDRVLKDAEAIDGRVIEQGCQWKIIEDLFSVGHQKNEKHDEIIAACGLPCTSIDKQSLGSAQQIMTRIVERVVSEGLNNFFEQLSVSLEDIFSEQTYMIGPIKSALGELQEHLTRQSINAPQFEEAPRFYYSPYRNLQYSSELPEWWKILTADLWEKLLDDEEPEPEEELNVRLENKLFSPKKGHPPVVLNSAAFTICPTASGILPELVIIERGIGTRALMHVGEVAPRVTPEWTDNSPPSHEKYLRYKFSAHGENLRNSIIRLISLENFVPGVVIDARAAKKITPLKKAKGTTAKKAIWECDLTLQGKEMQHQFDVYFSSKVKLTNKLGYYNANDKRVLTENFHSEHAGKKQFVLDLVEEGYIELTGIMVGTKKEFTIHARVHLEDIEASGVGSWFEKLIAMHCTKQSNFATHRIDVTWKKSQLLSKWILDNKDSYHPLVMGYDYQENWKNPDWKSSPVMSKYKFSNDIRPRKENFVPPDKLLECRESVRNLVNKEDGVIELINLGELAEEPNFRANVIAYMQAYSEWLTKDRDNALWFDTIVVIRPEATGSVLSQQPDALMLNPLHPIRLGWQVYAQHVLYSSLMRQKHCPAAGVLDPCLTPDCMMLPCWTAGQKVNTVHFISTASNSDFWAVLWNGNAIDSLSDESVGKFFSDDFGIKLDGIAAGFSVVQVGRALRDVSMIRSARACLRVRLIDDTIGSSSCTEGIKEWSMDNFGEEDQWFNAGPKSLEIYDARNSLQWPNPRIVANLTDDTLASVKWFKGSKKDGDTIDLTIINHLGSMNPSLAHDDIPSAVGQGGLIRQRIRRQLPTDTGDQFICESRKSPPHEKQCDDISEMIEHISYQLENTCDNVDSYSFAPKIPRIQENLKESRYCAVSSTIVDPSCFFDAGKNAYLWDYDLPGYGRRAGSNNGYYLIASETAAILQAVRANLAAIAQQGYQFSNDMIRSILREISGRGIPTLKRLITQGATATGEIGLFVALRILQDQNEFSESLFPLSGDKHVNLVIPIDPFWNIIKDLKGSIGMSSSRPDILAVSIHYHHHQISFKFTPIEVKHRSGNLIASERQSALEQASDFSKFMADMDLIAKDEHIWRIAFTSLLVTMIDFGFRTMSAARGMGGSKEWAEIHSVVLQALMSGQAKREIDHRGRLIIVDQSASNILDLDNDSFKETLVLQTNDAFKIITSQNTDIMKKIKASLQDWGLLAIAKDIRMHEAGEVKKIEQEDAGETIEPISFPPPIEECPVTAGTEQGQEQDNLASGDTLVMGVYFPVGKDITSPFQDPDVYFHPSNTQLNQLNIGIVGDLGTGKTQLTKSMIYRFIKSEKENRGTRPRFLIFDYKGDYLDQEFINAVGGRVVKPYRIPLNLFDISGKEAIANPIIDTAGFFNDIIGKIYKVDKPIQQYVLREAIKECYGSLQISEGIYPTIYNVHNAYKIKLNGKFDSTLGILSGIVDRELFEQKASGVKPFKEFFDGVVVIDLKALGQDDDTKNMLVVIFLHLFYDHMLKIEKRAIIGDNPKLRFIDSVLLVDEANSIMKYNFDVLDNILLQGREFGVGVLLASQYLSHFRTQQKNYAEPLLTWFIHKVPNITKRELENIGLIEVDTDIIERIKSLEIHECLYKSFGTGKKATFMYGYPFYKVIKEG